MKPHRSVVGAVLVLTLVSQGKAIPTQGSPTGGTLAVSQSGRGPLLTEGGITFFQVYANERVVEERMLGGKLVKNVYGQSIPQSTREGDTATFTLPAGSYELRGYVRGCDGNCGALGVPQDECRALFTMQDSDSLKAVREQKSNGSCAIQITSKRK